MDTLKILCARQPGVRVELEEVGGMTTIYFYRDNEVEGKVVLDGDDAIQLHDWLGDVVL
jgi:hypothetical protein